MVGKALFFKSVDFDIIPITMWIPQVPLGTVKHSARNTFYDPDTQLPQIKRKNCYYNNSNDNHLYMPYNNMPK